MILADWLKQRNWTNRDLAAPLGVSEEYVRLLRAARRSPSDHLQHRIFQITEGEVTPADLELAFHANSRKAS